MPHLARTRECLKMFFMGYKKIKKLLYIFSFQLFDRTKLKRILLQKKKIISSAEKMTGIHALVNFRERTIDKTKLIYLPLYLRICAT